MHERATGVIVRLRPLTESSLIVNWLTREHGRISTVARGARRLKSAFRGKLDLYFQAELSFIRSRRGDLHTLKELSVATTHPALRRDIHRLQQAAYAVALLEQVTERDTPIAEAYDLFDGWLARLGTVSPTRKHVLGLEMKTLSWLGLSPDFSNHHNQNELAEIAGQLTELSWEELETRTPDAKKEAALSRFLHGFLIYHLGRLPKGRAAALGQD